ncbi:Translation machinery-associated protein 20 [Ceratocystis lukuohia]|uniref:Translation machinery-associated protein 20 n=1 Tax=Ceratocystis lukuohia TaxID=2019550 RepID=A0ABR4MK29_9PEZI
MPLIVPGLQNVDAQSSNAKSQSSWEKQLMGKTLNTDGKTDELTFAVEDLPEVHRIIQPGQNVTRDTDENRLNVLLDGDGTVRNVYFG